MSAAASGPVRDPGLQPERTRLAWRRTTLSATVAAVLAAKQTLHGGASLAAVVALALSAAAWIAFLRVAHRRVRETDTAQPPPLSPRVAWTATACTLALAVFAAAMVL
ncbi:DUF202 domain-containing protein [Streptomyces sp. AM 2-1-1]|uniref:DUF202 domain-containing protein n=1 Tax=Streptomyces sp. AM 2-1-1 TaxID=3028709 RepID=UPI0023B9E672|nr:DUF202 domain-containing protein [Streptomyces sp. AM 2-1-1]WEH42642.1 DUF202 domain-containing protein [Streptomyces sp. AM 2-1-1]